MRVGARSTRTNRMLFFYTLVSRPRRMPILQKQIQNLVGGKSSLGQEDVLIPTSTMLSAPTLLEDAMAQLVQAVLTLQMEKDMQRGSQFLQWRIWYEHSSDSSMA